MYLHISSSSIFLPYFYTDSLFFLNKHSLKNSFNHLVLLCAKLVMSGENVYFELYWGQQCTFRVLSPSLKLYLHINKTESVFKILIFEYQLDTAQYQRDTQLENVHSFTNTSDSDPNLSKDHTLRPTNLYLSYTNAFAVPVPKLSSIPSPLVPLVLPNSSPPHFS